MYAIDYEDLGTPQPADASGTRRPSRSTASSVTVPDGTSVMRAAALAGVKVPKLCATDTLKAFGSCRLCLVEIEGRKGYPASCTTTVAAGMKVRTQSPKLMRAAPQGDGAVHLRSPARVRQLSRPRATASCRTWRTCVGIDRDLLRRRASRCISAGATDESNPYFTFDPELCIVCSRCVRACDEMQGTFALTIQGRGFDSKVSASQNEPFLESECVSCGACVEACPTAALTEKSLIGLGAAERAVTTTCAYCGVGCCFKAEVRGEGADVEVVRMVPNRDGHANHGHACVKGRFAWGYATHPDRITKPMIRKSIPDHWREVSWDEAIGYAASEFRRIQAKYGRDSIGGITSSRCTNEETFLVQKLVRAAFGNNNVDTCARVCHSPDRLRPEEHARRVRRHAGVRLGHEGGRRHDHRRQPDRRAPGVRLADEAPPAPGREADHRRPARDRRSCARRTSQADYHLQLQPGTNVALLNALAHVVVTEGLAKEDYVAERCEPDVLREVEGVRRRAAQLARGLPRRSPACRPSACARAARLYATAGNGAIYYGLGVTEHSQGTTTVMAIANLAMATGNLGREGVGVTRCAARTTCRARATWARSRTSSAATATCRTRWCAQPSRPTGASRCRRSRACASRTCSRRRSTAPSRACTCRARTSCSPIPTRITSSAAMEAHGVRRRAGPVPERDRASSRTCSCRARRSSRRTAPSPTPSGASRVCARSMRAARRLRGLGGHLLLSNALGYPMNYTHPSRDHGRDRAPDPDLHGVTYEKLDRLGSIQWPCNDEHPDGTPTMHVDQFVRGKGKFCATEYVPTERALDQPLPADPDHRPHPEPVQRRRADAAHQQRRLARRGRARDPSARRRGARHRRRRLGRARRAAPARPCCAPRLPSKIAPGRGLHDVPLPGDQRQRGHHRELRLGHQLPGVQGDGGRGGARQSEGRLEKRAPDERALPRGSASASAIAAPA